MGITEDMKRVALEIVSSYQARVSTVAKIVDDTHQILEDFRAERKQMSEQLKETLAKEESLRRKDFDNMIGDIFIYQDESEEEVKNLLKTFFEEQKEIAELLKRNLGDGKKVKIEDFKKTLENIQSRQKARENEVSTTLKEFQSEHKEMAESLRSLLDKGEAIEVKDFKEAVNNIRAKQDLVFSGRKLTMAAAK
ncbi:MAG: hypothetical protein ABIE75_03535 [Candidatus Omnitrophota bacterium]